ncbi:MAG: RagB/SusD family nutrient uptake outer membrane protein [Bacteroides sp.]|nr:RagB/SusD family nutrient uptake outer membrane protein [Roseburia sp.]MCM1347030.1 RagB/SusD family nutrient uptake outer membrane protein [Bacteroides sp.]MCM1421523.1 RagB/SusD family nutrient uptake outer membrane protein [Bacteroides sp.]
MKRINSILLAALAVAFTSCGDFLEEVSQDEFEPKTTNSFIELMNGEGYISFPVDPMTYMMDDDVNGCKSAFWTNAIRTRQEIFCWQPDFWRLEDECSDLLASIKNSYQNIYKAIAVCNIIIERAPKSQGTQEEKDICCGEAKTMRAFYYLQLVNTYALPYNDSQTSPEANLGVSLVTESEVKETGMPRATVAKVYEQIIRDIEDACELFGDNKTDRGKYRVAYTAAHLLASRIYLHTENWEKVVEHATKAMEAAPPLANLNSYTIDNVQSPTNGVISTKFPEVIFIGGMKAMSGAYGLMGTPYGVSTDFASTFSVMDSRMNVYLQPSGYDYPYRIFKICADEHEFVWRTAELYLNRAEAYFNQYKRGDIAAGKKCTDDLEALMAKRYLRHTPPTDSDIDVLQSLLRSERRKELCYEGFRFFDLKRYGMPSIEHVMIGENGGSTTYTLEERDPAYCVPLPDKALDHNENLVQNPLAARRTGR